jgi:hypothetical protein
MNYAPLASTARKLISSAGKPVTLVRTSGESFDPVSGVSSSSSTTIFLGAGVETEFDYATRDQSMALQASKRLLCVNIPAPVPSSDRLTVGGVDYLVVRSAPLEPGTVTLLFDVWVM